MSMAKWDCGREVIADGMAAQKSYPISQNGVGHLFIPQNGVGHLFIPRLFIPTPKKATQLAKTVSDTVSSASEQGGGFLQASAPASNDLGADVETRYSRKCLEKRTQALRGRNLGRDIPVDSAPIARQWCGQSRRTLLRRDCFLDSPWTQE